MTPQTPTRRTVLAVGAGIGAGAGALAVAAPAEAATTPGHYRGAPLLSVADHHLVTRFSYGVTPGLTAQVRAAGGARKWFEAQLSPDAISDGAADALVGWWPSLSYDAQTLWQRQLQEIEGGWMVMANYQRWLLVRRITTERQVAEIMAEFWMNHLHVPVHDDASFTWRFDYDKVVRRNALGTFEQMLLECTTHPAMGMFLDNAVSTKAAPNENLGRELLELHTVGRGNYTEDDVKSSARILTGYLVDMWKTWVAGYVPKVHWTGPVQVMGFSDPNANADGRDVVRRYLSYLAHHPATAQRIARKLAKYFVSDTPSQGLVDRLAQVYLDNDTAIKPVLRALIMSSEFKQSGKLVRDPSADVVATYRSLGAKIEQPPATENGWAATAILWQAQAVGQPPFEWPRPDGQPVDSESWASPARLLASMDVHWSMSGGWWPSQGVRYVKAVDWLPEPRIAFNVLVDHLSQQLLGKRSTGLLLKACIQAMPDELKVRQTTMIDRNHGVVRWNFHRLLSTILDSPAQFSR